MSFVIAVNKMDDDRIEFDSLDAQVKEDHAKEGEAVVLNPGKVDEALWEKAKRAAEEAGATDKWAFITWWYKKQGGTFK
jgi:hypothetical protein